MDNTHAFGHWAVVELLGKEGETFDDVIKRISAEAVPPRDHVPGWSFIRLNLDTIRRETEPQEPAASAPARYRWKDPEVKNRSRKPRTNVSRETSRSVSVARPKMEKTPVDWTWNDGTPIVVNREQIELMTQRQTKLAMQILSGKE